MSVDSDAARAGDSGWRETVKIVIHALILAIIVRIFFYQPFNIPSGSMMQTLLEGDYLFVSKLSYGYSKYSFPYGVVPFTGRIWGAQPKRGDVVVFKLPRDTDKDYIKRILGLPGDVIDVRKGIVYINGTAVPRVRDGDYMDPREGPIPRYKETLPNGVSYYVLDRTPNGSLDDVGPYVVPPGHYFMMGDNRDNSVDSRVPASKHEGVGFVPFENLVGRAEIIFFSVAIDDPRPSRTGLLLASLAAGAIGALAAHFGCLLFAPELHRPRRVAVVIGIGVLAALLFYLTSPWAGPFDIRWGRIFSLVR